MFHVFTSVRLLQERKKTFLAQVAAIKGVSKAELNELVDSAVIGLKNCRLLKKCSREISNLCSFTDAGGDEREAKKLRKEFNSDVQRAKDELGIDARKSGV